MNSNPAQNHDPSASRDINLATKPATAARLSSLILAATVFVSAFLLFQVQPLMGKCILPWFGGTPAVWSTCMLFFQMILFGGYAYAHILSQRPHSTQVLVHGTLLLLAVYVLPITPSANWKPQGDESPVPYILLLLTTSVGLPYFLLCATGPLVQSWFRVLHPGKSPYRLYALSNTGSLLALITYPFLVEPALAMPYQASCWSGLFIGFSALCLISATIVWWQGDRQATLNSPEPSGSATTLLATVGRTGNLLPALESSAQRAPTTADRWLWFALAAAASTLLLATTNQVCQDVASVPFLWIVPLTLYLLTFILCFDGEHWYRRWTFAWSAGIAAAVVSVILQHGSYVPLLVQGGAYFTALFCCCMVCHGELAGMKPDPRYLTSFYLTMSAGGAAGGVLVNLIAPHVFPAYWELHLALLACILLTLVVCYRDRNSTLYRGQPAPAWFCLGLAVCWLTVMLGKDALATVHRASGITRGFFGVLRVLEANVNSENSDSQDHLRLMVHGRIVHGLQFEDRVRSRRPTAYYHSSSGVGRALTAKQQGGPVHVGVIGLGVGTIATYGRAGDSIRFYEIDPNVVRVARSAFSYLADCAAHNDIVLGDGRLSLEREPGQAFDMLAVDAFSGDAIPTHLLTAEALHVYLRHLKPDGILAIHYSNLHFDLEPVLRGLAEQGGLALVRVQSPANEAEGIKEAHWALLARDESQLRANPIGEAAHPLPARRIDWTDDRNNLFEILR